MQEPDKQPATFQNAPNHYIESPSQVFSARPSHWLEILPAEWPRQPEMSRRADVGRDRYEDMAVNEWVVIRESISLDDKFRSLLGIARAALHLLDSWPDKDNA